MLKQAWRDTEDKRNALVTTRATRTTSGARTIFKVGGGTRPMRSAGTIFLSFPSTFCSTIKYTYNNSHFDERFRDVQCCLICCFSTHGAQCSASSKSGGNVPSPRPMESAPERTTRHVMTRHDTHARRRLSSTAFGADNISSAEAKSTF